MQVTDSSPWEGALIGEVGVSPTVIQLMPPWNKN